jgi:hypothetical protein
MYLTDVLYVLFVLLQKQLESGGELEDGDPLNNFFKKIFSQV